MDITTFIFVIPILIFLGFVLYQIKTKGFKGATFGAKIMSTYGEIKLSPTGTMRGHIKIHALENRGKKNVGIEVVQKTLLSYDMTALNFERDDIIELISALTIAVEDTEQARVDNPSNAKNNLISTCTSDFTSRVSIFDVGQKKNELEIISF